MEIEQYQWNCEEPSKWLDFFALPLRTFRESTSNKVPISDYIDNKCRLNLIPVVSASQFVLCEHRFNFLQFEMPPSLSR